MKYFNDLWKSFDDLDLFVNNWQPDNYPKAIINFIHGLGSHSRRIEELAKKFVDAGYAVLTFDLRGHGMSEGRIGYVKSYDFIMKDIDNLLAHSDKIYPNIPKIIYGHSLGGNLVLNYVLTHKFDCKAAIVTSPWLSLVMQSSMIKIIICKLLAKVYPSLVLKTGLNPKFLSHDFEKVEEYINDPLIHYRLNIHFYTEICDKGRWILNNTEKLSMPLLLMHGNADKITSHKASAEFAENSKEQTTLKIWDNLFHELHNETNRDEVFEYMVNWIEEL
ncbi:MAG: alpha/beta hydrolase [Bacteroidetes bacterium]|nr:alpha/beta hydrolase [Bacteroidota bacterium]